MPSPQPISASPWQRGDALGLTNTAGIWFARYAYDPYGRVLSQTTQAAGAITATLASQIATRQVLRYASYAYDAHSATYYLAARHYDPASARFLTKDPARDDGEESAYQYCGGEPVGKVDPSGEVAIAALPLIIKVAVIAAAAVGTYFTVKWMIQITNTYNYWRNTASVYTEYGSWARRNRPKLYGLLDDSARLIMSKQWSALTSDGHRRVVRESPYSQVRWKLQVYVFTQKCGVKGIIKSYALTFL